MRLHGTETYLDGLIAGVHHLYVEDGSFVRISSTAQTALIEGTEYVNMTAEGNITFPSLNVRREAVLQLRTIEIDIFIDSPIFEIKYDGTVLMNYGSIEASFFDVESEAILDLEGRGHSSNSGSGAGANTNGASYGGYGGGPDAGDSTEPYGSLFTPRLRGSGGGGSGAGSGGGFLELRIGDVFHVDGTITVAGAAASSGSSGGGSGGSLLVKAFNMSGHGVLDATGGDASGSGGGGSGGRMSLEIEFENKWGGKYLMYGGNGPQNPSLYAGASGTVYKYESNRGPQYRELKYNPRLNRTQVESDHRMVIVDNAKHETLQPALLMEKDSVYYEFEEVQVEGYSYVWFYHPDNVHNVTTVIHELKGNKKGYVVVRDHQRVIVNFVESTHTYLDAPCGFVVEVGGEIVLPTQVIILAETFQLLGRLTGVEELDIEREGMFQISGEAHTGKVPNDARWYNDKNEPEYQKGHMEFGTLHVNNKGEFRVSMNPLVPTIEVPDISVKSGGLLNSETRQVEFEGSLLDLEKGGTMEANEAGYGANEGTGAGLFDSSEGGGGGHGSTGGTSERNNKAGGSYYGTLYTPTTFGSGGAGSSGSSGGGHMKLSYTSVCLIRLSCGVIYYLFIMYEKVRSGLVYMYHIIIFIIYY